jgi:hypothetical protein
MISRLNPRSEAERKYWAQFLGCPACGAEAGDPCRDMRAPWTDRITSMAHQTRPRKGWHPPRNGRKHLW